MDDYIKREDATAHPFANGKFDHKNASMDFILGHESYREWLQTLPSADVRENKKGHWHNVTISRMGNSAADCSICGATVYNNFTKHMPPSFCPNCGADMRGEKNETN